MTMLLLLMMMMMRVDCTRAGLRRRDAARSVARAPSALLRDLPARSVPRSRPGAGQSSANRAGVRRYAVPLY